MKVQIDTENELAALRAMLQQMDARRDQMAAELEKLDQQIAHLTGSILFVLGKQKQVEDSLAAQQAEEAKKTTDEAL